ncbi:MAG: hypothetical protein V8S10_07600 [Clostridia bacterium]|jgi:hypothetical protein
MNKEIKKELNIKTKELKDILEKSFKEESLKYKAIHPSYNSKNDRNDDEILFITCYIEIDDSYGIHIDNRLESTKWVIDIVIMKPDNRFKIINILKNNGIHYEDYNGECHGEFEGHIKLFELDKNIRLNEIKNINVKLLKLFQ